jgi:hypothetical protein
MLLSVILPHMTDRVIPKPGSRWPASVKFFENSGVET